MKITRQQLKQIIKEELRNVMEGLTPEEDYLYQMSANWEAENPEAGDFDIDKIQAMMDKAKEQNLIIRKDMANNIVATRGEDVYTYNLSTEEWERDLSTKASELEH